MKELIEKGSTLFLRLALISMALAVAGLCALILPNIYFYWAKEFPEISFTTYPILIGLVGTALAFWTALFQAWRILGYIEEDKLFSSPTLKSLDLIKRYAFLISLLYAMGWPIIYHLAQLEDAPGLIIIYGAIFIGTPLIAAVAVMVLQRLLQKVILMKSENDLTV